MSATAVLAPHGPRIVSWSRMSDEALARRAAAGNEAAFTALYERYHGPLLNYCRSILLNADDAHDATQSALENALRALPRREPDRPLKPWLYRIAHNEAINIVRRRQPIASGVKTDDLLTVPGPDVASEQRTRLAQLVDDLRMLPERQRGALVMRELSGLSYDEIGLALGISGEASRRAVFDARSALHDAVDGRATECVNVRRCLSDGDRRRLRARGMRAHLRACDDCATFQLAIGARQVDLHLLGPWIAGTSVLGLVGIGTGGGTALASGSILTAAAGGGGSGAAAVGSSVGWGGLPVAVKGLAVAAAVATTGTAAVELPKVARDAAPAPAPASVRAAATAPAISPLHHPAREQAIADAAQAAARRARAAREARAAARLRTSAGTSSNIAVADRGARTAPPITPVTPAPTAPVPAPTPATTIPAANNAAPAPQRAISEIEQIRDRILAALKDAQAIAAPGTQTALATASALIQNTLASVGPLLDEVLATFGLTLPSNLMSPPAPSSTSPSSQVLTNVMAPVQSLLSGVDGLLQSLFGRG